MTTNYSQPPMVQAMQFGQPSQNNIPNFQFPSFNGTDSSGGVNAALSQFGQNANQNQAFNPMGMLGGGMDMSPMAQGGGIPSWGVGTPGAGGGFFGNGTGLGMNMPTLQLGMQGLGALGSLWMGGKSLNLANRQQKFTEEVTNTNLNNQLKTYNSGLEDRLRTRGQFNGDDPEKAKSEYERQKLSRA